MHGAAKRQLLEVCAVHCHLRIEYIIACRLWEKHALSREVSVREKMKIFERLEGVEESLNALLLIATESISAAHNPHQ